jgi:hypothetical protein
VFVSWRCLQNRGLRGRTHEENDIMLQLGQKVCAMDNIADRVGVCNSSNGKGVPPFRRCAIDDVDKHGSTTNFVHVIMHTYLIL